jgi:Uma2 family endonuclease
MGEIGFLEGRRVELMGGEIIEMSPIGPLHTAVVTHIRRKLERLFPDHHVRDQQPFDAADDSEPEPDIALVPGEPAAYRDAHPKQAVLIVEVADTSLQYDSGRKASRYAASGVADYWVVNLAMRRVEICRKPERDASQQFGFAYTSHDIVDASGHVSLLAFPAISIPVKDLLL